AAISARLPPSAAPPGRPPTPLPPPTGPEIADMRLSPRDRLLACILVCLPAGPAAGADSLSDRIDVLIAAGHKDYTAAAAPVAADDEFLRRVTLDRVGRVPSATEARAFFADRSPFKRVQLIDNLLASPECSRRLAQHVDVMLLDRRQGPKVPR